MVYWGKRGREVWKKSGVLVWSGWFTVEGCSGFGGKGVVRKFSFECSKCTVSCG